jgi:hypothetical protein
MGWFSKNVDPIDARARDLERELAALDSEIAETDDEEPRPAYRSTVVPGQGPVGGELIMEDYDQSTLKAPPTHLQEQFDSISSKPTGFRERFKRLKKEVGAAPVSNPKLVKLLSSGNIEGLQPLRYERRVARNRFLFLFFLLLLVLTGLAMVLTRNY